MNINLKDQILRGPEGIKVILDASEIFPNNPGLGTPAMVHLSTGDTATFNCVDSELEVDGIRLTSAQENWIRSIGDEIDNWLTYWTINNPHA